jgi:hypothetical protein
VIVSASDDKIGARLQYLQWGAGVNIRRRWSCEAQRKGTCTASWRFWQRAGVFWWC